MIINKNDTLDTFRCAILDAVDDAALEVFGARVLESRGGRGTTDADLPDLFKGIAAHVERLAQRFGAILIDPIQKVA